MIVRKNYRNVWLNEDRMEQQFPDLVKHFNGLGWGEEDESVLNTYGFDFKKDKEVSFYSTNGDVAKVINRCAKAIKRMRINTFPDGTVSGVDFMISRDAFRSSINSFNTKYVPDTPYETVDAKDKRKVYQMSDEHKAKIQAGRKNSKNGKTKTHNTFAW